MEGTSDVDPEDPFKSPPQQPREEYQCDVNQLINFIALILLGSGSMLCWHFNLLGESNFPWFLIVIGIFICSWAIHFWMSLFCRETDDRKKRKFAYELHRSLYVTINGVLFLIWMSGSDRKSIPWFVYTLAVSTLAVTLHYTLIWVPRHLRWIVFQLFLYCIIVLADFILWYIKPEEYPSWVWMVVAYCILVLIQGLIYLVMRYITPPTNIETEREKRFKSIISRFPPLFSPSPSYSSFSSTASSSTNPSDHDWTPDSGGGFNNNNNNEITTMTSSFEKKKKNDYHHDDNDKGLEEDESGSTYVKVSNPVYSAFPTLRSNDDHHLPLDIPRSPSPRVYTIEFGDDNNTPVSVTSFQKTLSSRGSGNLINFAVL